MPLVGTLVDGNPDNNFFDRKYLNLPPVVRFNPDGKFTGLEHGYFAGQHHLYLVGRNGFFVVDVSDPLHPKLRAELTAGLKNPRALSVQWRYAFVSDDDGVKVVDLSNPDAPRLAASLPLAHAGRLYAARTYLYVPDGPEGLAIVDIQNPERPALVEHFNAGGVLNDARAVQIGSISASMYALVADGKNGLRVIQMISPENVPGHYGFSPAPNPKLIATFPTAKPAVAVGRGLDRDRVVDESGGQTVVFGRRGSRPFNEVEFGLLLRHLDPATGKHIGATYTVEDLTNKGSAAKTKSGTELKPTREFQGEPEPKLAEHAPLERLIRRGRE